MKSASQCMGRFPRSTLEKSHARDREAACGVFEVDAIKSVYLHGHKKPELISPDNWNMDFRMMERPGARRVQLDLFYDYRTNVTLYPKWQAFLRDRQPRTIIFWVRTTSSSPAKAGRPT